MGKSQIRKTWRGLTLIELMLVIISNLAEITYPSYRQYVAKAKRNEANQGS
jgi:Tfp pilus assembly protein PilE